MGSSLDGEVETKDEVAGGTDIHRAGVEEQGSRLRSLNTSKGTDRPM